MFNYFSFFRKAIKILLWEYFKPYKRYLLVFCSAVERCFCAPLELCWFLQFCQAEVRKQGSSRRGRRVLRQGQSQQLLLCCILGSARALESQAGLWGTGQDICVSRRWLGPSISCCWLPLCCPIPRSRNSRSDFSCVSHKLEQPRLDPWAAKFNFACTTGDFYQGWCGSCCLPWCWCELEKEVLYKCCLMATSCVAQPHSKGTLLECVQNYKHLSSLSP